MHINEYTPLEKCEIMAHIQKKMKNTSTHCDVDSDSAMILSSPQYRLMHLNDNEKRTRSDYLAFVKGIHQLEDVNAIFCSACVLFGTGNGVLRTKGVSVKNYSEANKQLTRHESNKGHITAYNLYREYDEQKRSIGLYM